MCWWRFPLLCLWLALALNPGAAHAQLYGNAIPAELLDLQAGNVWFGSVRSSSGRFLENATVILDTGMIEYIAVTGRNGRFRLVLPETTVIDEVAPSCALTGFAATDVMVRPPSRNGQSPVELSCLLR
jgi:hypothetical protein